MDDIRNLIEQNRAWAAQVEKDNPDLFTRLAQQQSPEYLWIGCSDSRVPATQITGSMPGDVFVHRNVANVISHTDPNCMSVIEYAVQALKVRHIIVCGHYGCGGVQAALTDNATGTVGQWLSGIRDLRDQHKDELDQLDEDAASARLSELNVLHQVQSLCSTPVIQDAWSRGQEISVHALIYGLADGLLRSLGDPKSSASDN